MSSHNSNNGTFEKVIVQRPEDFHPLPTDKLIKAPGKYFSEDHRSTTSKFSLDPLSNFYDINRTSASLNSLFENVPKTKRKYTKKQKVVDINSNGIQKRKYQPKPKRKSSRNVPYGDECYHNSYSMWTPLELDAGIEDFSINDCKLREDRFIEELMMEHKKNVLYNDIETVVINESSDDDISLAVPKFTTIPEDIFNSPVKTTSEEDWLDYFTNCEEFLKGTDGVKNYVVNDTFLPVATNQHPAECISFDSTLEHDLSFDDLLKDEMNLYLNKDFTDLDFENTDLTTIFDCKSPQIQYPTQNDVDSASLDRILPNQTIKDRVESSSINHVSETILDKTPEENMTSVDSGLHQVSYDNGDGNKKDIISREFKITGSSQNLNNYETIKTFSNDVEEIRQCQSSKTEREITNEHLKKINSSDNTEKEVSVLADNSQLTKSLNKNMNLSNPVIDHTYNLKFYREENQNEHSSSFISSETNNPTMQLKITDDTFKDFIFNLVKINFEEIEELQISQQIGTDILKKVNIITIAANEKTDNCRDCEKTINENNLATCPKTYNVYFDEPFINTFGEIDEVVISDSDDSDSVIIDGTFASPIVELNNDSAKFHTDKESTSTVQVTNLEVILENEEIKNKEIEISGDNTNESTPDTVNDTNLEVISANIEKKNEEIEISGGNEKKCFLNGKSKASLSFKKGTYNCSEKNIDVESSPATVNDTNLEEMSGNYRKMRFLKGKNKSKVSLNFKRGTYNCFEQIIESVLHKTRLNQTEEAVLDVINKIVDILLRCCIMSRRQRRTSFKRISKSKFRSHCTPHRKSPKKLFSKILFRMNQILGKFSGYTKNSFVSKLRETTRECNKCNKRKQNFEGNAEDHADYTDKLEHFPDEINGQKPIRKYFKNDKSLLEDSNVSTNVDHRTQDKNSLPDPISKHLESNKSLLENSKIATDIDRSNHHENSLTDPIRRDHLKNSKLTANVGKSINDENLLPDPIIDYLKNCKSILKNSDVNKDIVQSIHNENCLSKPISHRLEILNSKITTNVDKSIHDSNSLPVPITEHLKNDKSLLKNSNVTTDVAQSIDSANCPPKPISHSSENYKLKNSNLTAVVDQRIMDENSLPDPLRNNSKHYKSLLKNSNVTTGIDPNINNGNCFPKSTSHCLENNKNFNFTTVIDKSIHVEDCLQKSLRDCLEFSDPKRKAKILCDLQNTEPSKCQINGSYKPVQPTFKREDLCMKILFDKSKKIAKRNRSNTEHSYGLEIEEVDPKYMRVTRSQAPKINLQDSNVTARSNSSRTTNMRKNTKETVSRQTQEFPRGVKMKVKVLRNRTVITYPKENLQ